MPITKDPAFAVYLVTAVVLALEMVLLDTYSGLIRGQSRTVVNPEDKGAKSSVVDVDPPPVARVLRAHRNLLANAVPFLILGLLWVLSGASYAAALGLFGTFVAARLAHAFFYVGAKQPWRTLSFVV